MVRTFSVTHKLLGPWAFVASLRSLRNVTVTQWDPNVRFVRPPLKGTTTVTSSPQGRRERYAHQIFWPKSIFFSLSTSQAAPLTAMQGAISHNNLALHHAMARCTPAQPPDLVSTAHNFSETQRMKQVKKKPELPPSKRQTVHTAEPQKEVGRKRLLTLDGLDQRTRAFQAVNKTIGAIEADLGGSDHLSHAERSLVQRCAILSAMLGDAEAAYLTGQAIDPANYCTLVNAFRRTLETVGLKRVARDVTPSVAEYVAHLKAEEKESAGA